MKGRIYIYIYVFICLFIFSFIYLFVYSCVYSFIYLCVYLFVCVRPFAEMNMFLVHRSVLKGIDFTTGFCLSIYKE